MAVDHPDPIAARTRPWQVVDPVLAVRLMQAVLWLVVVAAPVVAGFALVEVATLRSQLAATATPPKFPLDTAHVEGVAELAVADHLTAQTGAEGEGWRVEATTSLGATEVTPGHVTATVAAHVTATDPTADPASDPGLEAPRRLVFSVGLVDTGAGWAPVGVPALVAAPAVAAVEAADGGGRRLDEIPGLAESVTRFLAAYLTGDGELARYTAPAIRLTAVSPPPFVAINVTDAATTELSNGTRHVSVSVTGFDAAGRELTVAYWLVVAERDGRWEVTDLLPAPPPEVPAQQAREGGGSG